MSERKSPLNVVILGLENAGKTTLLQRMAGSEFSETLTTIGINVELLDYKGISFQAIDIGGQQTFRETLWSHYATLAKGVIFVFDIFERKKMNEAFTWFTYIQNWISENAKLIFLANKIDLKKEKEGFLSLEEIVKKFQLDKLSSFPRRSFRIFEISAKTGENVEEAISWFFEKILEEVKEDKRVSFIYILNKNNNIIYASPSEKERERKVPIIITETIDSMKKIGIKQNLVSLENQVINIVVEETFSVVLGSKHKLSSYDLITATSSIASLIKNSFYPPEKYEKELHNVVHTAFLKSIQKEIKGD
ncbi:MAG: ADP-ribosylation factor family protein [Candidatus Heimdallarchaeaceae archaeon]